MRIFNCIKCGNANPDKVGLRYHTAKIIKLENGLFIKEQNLGERLECACLICGYSWKEKTSDNKDIDNDTN